MSKVDIDGFSLLDLILLVCTFIVPQMLFFNVGSASIRCNLSQENEK